MAATNGVNDQFFAGSANSGAIAFVSQKPENQEPNARERRRSDERASVPE
jgi:hypothetical protein